MENETINTNGTQPEISLSQAQAFAASNGIVYIDLTNDYAFKYALGSPGREKDLLYLLQNIIPEKRIRSLTLLQGEQNPELPDAKKVIYDIFCESGDGTYFVVEMQVGEEKDFADRMVFYSTFPVRNQVLRGGRYHLTDVYVVSLLKFIMPGVKRNDRIINHYSIINREDIGMQLTDHVHFVTVELPKITGDVAKVADNPQLRLLYTIANLGEMKELPDFLQKDENLHGIIKSAIFANMNQMSQREYIARVMAEIDERSRLETAEEKGIEKGIEKGRAEGLAEGIEKGIEQGIEKGMEKGMEKGREQGLVAKAYEVAHSMLKDNEPIEKIVKYSGLTREEIESL